MELFAIDVGNKEICQIVENESMIIVGYLEKSEKGYYIHLQDREIFWTLAKDDYPNMFDPYSKRENYRL